MSDSRVKDLMIPLDDFPVVRENATLLEAIEALDRAQESLPEGRQPFRAVLVINSDGKIVGKIGQLAFLKALEPKYAALGDLDQLVRAGVSDEAQSLMMEHFRFFQDDINDLCRRARTVIAGDAMHPLTESVAESDSLNEALHKIVFYQTLSMLVTRENDIVGILRLSDLFEEIARQMKC